MHWQQRLPLLLCLNWFFCVATFFCITFNLICFSSLKEKEAESHCSLPFVLVHPGINIIVDFPAHDVADGSKHRKQTSNRLDQTQQVSTARDNTDVGRYIVAGWGVNFMWRVPYTLYFTFHPAAAGDPNKKRLTAANNLKRTGVCCCFYFCIVTCSGISFRKGKGRTNKCIW